MKVLDADAVGITTVPKAVVAHHYGIKCAGITCITNMAAGVTNEILSHDDVKETTLKAKENFKKVIKSFINKI